MIANNMKQYRYLTLGEEDAYGQATVPANATGSVRMSISLTSQNSTDNVLYENCEYVGLTHANVDDTYIIEYGNERLKVKYVNPAGRYKQVFMVRT